MAELIVGWGTRLTKRRCSLCGQQTLYQIGSLDDGFVACGRCDVTEDTAKEAGLKCRA